MVKILCNTKEFDELLLDVMVQACGVQQESNDPLIEDGEPEIDNMCISAYEDACDYLTEQGYLYTINGRIYKFKKQKEVKPNSSHE